MRFARTYVLAFLFFLLAFPAFPQQTAATVQRSPQAVALLRSSIQAMGGSVPQDSIADGNVTIVAGSQTTTGTIQILTRGTTQTSVAVQTGTTNWSVIFSGGQANRIEAGTTTVLCLEQSASSQSLHFPLPFINGLLNNTDFSLQYIGQESLESSPANHVRVQNTYASAPSLQFLGDFTAADIWLDASTALPVRISLTRRNGGGSSPKIPISFSYSNYKTVAGVQYPFTIQEFLTGTLWATTSIQTVTFNTGLADSSFPVATEGN